MKQGGAEESQCCSSSSSCTSFSSSASSQMGFARRINLPDHLDLSGLSCSLMDDGQLRIHAPVAKQPIAEERQVPIRYRTSLEFPISKEKTEQEEHKDWFWPLQTDCLWNVVYTFKTCFIFNYTDTVAPVWCMDRCDQKVATAVNLQDGKVTWELERERQKDRQRERKKSRERQKMKLERERQIFFPLLALELQLSGKWIILFLHFKSDIFIPAEINVYFPTYINSFCNIFCGKR